MNKIIPELYVFRIGERYKIGTSTNVPERLRCLQCNAPDMIHLVHRFKFHRAKALELSLQRRFHSQQRYGEWFTLKPEDIGFIKNLTEDSAHAFIEEATGLPRLGKRKPKDPACELWPTITVRISKDLGQAISAFTANRRVDAAAHFGPLMEKWLRGELKVALKKAAAGEYSCGGGRPRGPRSNRKPQPPQATVRLWRQHVVCLKIVAAVYEKSLGEILEPKLWELLA